MSWNFFPEKDWVGLSHKSTEKAPLAALFVWDFDDSFYLPGLMKSDKPKSVAFRGESSLADLNKKFWKKLEGQRGAEEEIVSQWITWAVPKGYRTNECTSGFISLCTSPCRWHSPATLSICLTTTAASFSEYRLSFLKKQLKKPIKNEMVNSILQYQQRD